MCWIKRERFVTFAIKCKWIFFLIIVGGIANYITESIPFNIALHSNYFASTFSVLSYNVKCSSDNYYKNQIEIANEIIAESPDLIFLCEYSRSASSKLDSVLKHEGHYSQYYRSGMNSVFFCNEKIDSIIGIDTGISVGRNALNNKIHLILQHDTITVFGCHLSSSRRNYLEGRKRRHREADSLKECIDREIHPVIVMGDLNDFSGSYSINRIKTSGLKDAWWEGGFGYGATFHLGIIRLRLDHILYQDERFELIDVKVIESNYSDHYALMAEFSIKSNKDKNY